MGVINYLTLQNVLNSFLNCVVSFPESKGTSSKNGLIKPGKKSSSTRVGNHSWIIDKNNMHERLCEMQKT